MRASKVELRLVCNETEHRLSNLTADATVSAMSGVQMHWDEGQLAALRWEVQSLGLSRLFESLQEEIEAQNTDRGNRSVALPQALLDLI